MKTESAVPAIILVCSFVQIILGVSYFIDYELLIQFGWTGGTATAVLLVILFLLNRRSKSKGQVWDERFRTRFNLFVLLGFGITNIGIALLINSAFYDVGSVSTVSLIKDIVGILFIGWGIPLLLLGLSELGEGWKS
ncbi:hypothetical protein FIM07_02515 [SAR202 cluster bacterium AD-802-F09_MRT_200m]|nr:hypothetical protein [SAR202 cluster bacterium AD-802-F09_MRT_200m]